MVNAALIVMTILGCDDSVSQCHYIETVNGPWQTVAACDDQSQKRLPSYTKVNYPVVVAMCEKTGDAPIATAAETGAAPASGPIAPSGPEAAPSPPVVSTPAPVETAKPHLTERAYSMLKGVIPDGIKRVAIAPVHVIGDGYSWVARKVAR